MVGGYDEPWGVFFAGGLDGIVVRLLVARPEAALVKVGFGELPVLVGVCDAGAEAFGLLAARDVEKEFEDDDVVVGEHGFEFVYVVETLADDLLGHEFVNLGNKNVFVVRAVEDLDHASRRDVGVDPP